MTKNVIISLTGLQYAAEEEDAPIEVINFGQHYKKGEKHYLLYEETEEGGKTSKCRIKVSDKELELQKSDSFGTRLLFLPGEEYPVLERVLLGILGVKCVYLAYKLGKCYFVLSQRPVQIKCDQFYAIHTKYAFQSLYFLTRQSNCTIIKGIIPLFSDFMRSSSTKGIIACIV